MSADKEKSTPIDDANIVAFLMMKGFVAIPYIKEEAAGERSSQVAWEVQGEIASAINDFYRNECVGIRDYVKALKVVRGDMYSIKQLNNQLKDEHSKRAR